MKFRLLLITLFIGAIALAQTKGTISGTLTDKEANNATLPFANAVIKGTTIGTTTDENGKYILSVVPGSYVIVFSFLGYENIEVPFTIAAGEKITLNKTLGSGNYTIEDVTIKATTGREKETALLLEQKKSIEIKQSIGAQEMSRKGVSDVEQGLTKITGITKVDSRGLFVRGLEDRYNNLLINDLAAPTNNPFQKIIALDLFPTDIVSFIDVYKTFNPNIYGDFAGATFNIQTSRAVKSMTKLSIGVGYTTNNNMDDFLIAPGADNTEGFFGFNGKDRNLPGILGTTPANKRLTSQQSLAVFRDGYNVKKTTSPLNSSIGVLHSEKFSLKKDRMFSYLISTNFDNAYIVKRGVDRNINNADGGFKYTSDFVKSEYHYKTSSTSMLGFNYTSNRLKLSSNTLFIATTDNLIQDQVGSPTPGLNNQLIRTNQLDKTEYFNTQLFGEYAITSNKNNIFKGGISFAKTKYTQPDRKFLEGTLAADGEHISTSYSGSNLLRQYLNLDGNYFTSGLAEYSLKFGKKDKQNKLSIGYNGSLSSMRTTYRFISAKANTAIDPNPTLGGFSVVANDIDNTLNADLLNNYFYFEENSGVTFRVKLIEYNNTGYANLLLKFGEKWEVNGGVRFEANTRETKFRNSISHKEDPLITKKREDKYVLPSLNIKYAASEKTNFRFAASKTYTRPVTMESFPLTYINADGTSVQGNPLLKNSDNINADLKFEIFPTAKEMIAVGIFGKSIDNPIERTAIANATTGTVISFLNSDNAALYGVEAEFLVGLGRITNSLSDFSFGVNASAMSSKVNVSKNSPSEDENGTVTNKESIETFTTRKLQGASDLIINSDLKYQFNLSKTWSNTASLVYSTFSKRIYAVGTAGQDHIYEMPYQQLDFVWGSKLSDHFDLKFSAENLLDPAHERVFGNGGTSRIAEYSLTSKSFKKGIGFSLNLTYAF
jgi:TonB-dependent receptor